jgi:hypothetical protein
MARFIAAQRAQHQAPQTTACRALDAVIESWHFTVEFKLRQLEHFAIKACGQP